MPILDSISEFAFINRITEGLSVHPDQVNHRHEADAEIIRQPDGSFLAATVDAFYEEYHLGLIRDPYVIGWNLVANSLSDLAAVAAAPIGVLLALTIPPKQDPNWGKQLFAGVQAALTRHKTHCLGGDTSFGDPPQFSCTALGTIFRKKPLLRLGAGPDDLLFLTGPLGAGNMLAITQRFFPEIWKTQEKNFLPRAKFTEMQIFEKFAKCAIDTSDSLLQTLSILAGVNNIGIEFDHFPELYIPEIVTLTSKMHFPLWLTNVLGLGEYEILMSIERNQESDFVEEARRNKIPILKLGNTSSNPGIRMRDKGKTFQLDAPYLLNLYGTCPSTEAYIEKLVLYDRNLRK
ncbi:MAG: thiamine-monophosphate kinase [Candidatus Riflebacteria bacterium]|nr:thiamine-monophosphate kinase [Candidatus Riflebacteria bacterium]